MADELVESAIACVRMYAVRYALNAQQIRALFSAGLRAAHQEGWLPSSISRDATGSDLPGLPRFATDDGEVINLMDDGSFLAADGKRLRRLS